MHFLPTNMLIMLISPDVDMLASESPSCLYMYIGKIEIIREIYSDCPLKNIWLVPLLNHVLYMHGMLYNAIPSQLSSQCSLTRVSQCLLSLHIWPQICRIKGYLMPAQAAWPAFPRMTVLTLANQMIVKCTVCNSYNNVMIFDYIPFVHFLRFL